MCISLPIDDWVVCFDYTVGRMLLWRAGFRLRRHSADRLGVYLQPENAGQDRGQWKPCYVSEAEATQMKPVRELIVDEGYYGSTVRSDGTIGTSYGGAEMLAASEVMVMIVRRLKNDPTWAPSDSGAMGRKRTDHEHWTSAMNVVAAHPDWQRKLGIWVVKTLPRLTMEPS